MRATRAIVHLDIFRENLRLIRRRLQQNGRSAPKICLAVKADAYGHGISPIAQAAVEEGVEYLAVATVDEAITLREDDVSVPLLLYSLPIREEVPLILDHDITPLVGDLEFIRDLSAAAASENRRLPVHLKIDTGMGRIGCRPEDAVDISLAIDRDPWLQLEGVSTHFPNADDTDPGFTNEQIALFEDAVGRIREHGIDPGIVHAANSAGLLQHPESQLDMVRPGLLAYGYYSTDSQERVLPVRPVMELESRIVYLKSVPPNTPISYGSTYRTARQTWIATIPIGYGDGYSRLLSNAASVLVEERATGRRVRAPIAGRVCMDQLMLDLGPHTHAQRYDRVVLFGPDPEGPDAADLASLGRTIPYEVTCNISKRVPRVYRDGSSPGPERSQVDERLCGADH
jgi:alanine racemase